MNKEKVKRNICHLIKPVVSSSVSKLSFGSDVRPNRSAFGTVAALSRLSSVGADVLV